MRYRLRSEAMAQVTSSAAWVQPIAAQFERARAGLMDIVAAMPSAAWKEPSSNPGWTNHHVLAHVVDTAESRLLAVRAALGLQDVPPSRFTDRAARDERIESLAGAPAGDLRARFDELARETERLLAQLDDTHETLKNGELPLAFGDGLRYFAGHEADHLDELRSRDARA
jgi:uncharacterized protein (TIGR03083 family)